MYPFAKQTKSFGIVLDIWDSICEHRLWVRLRTWAKIISWFADIVSSVATQQLQLVMSCDAICWPFHARSAGSTWSLAGRFRGWPRVPYQASVTYRDKEEHVVTRVHICIYIYIYMYVNMYVRTLRWCVCYQSQWTHWIASRAIYRTLFNTHRMINSMQYKSHIVVFPCQFCVSW